MSLSFLKSFSFIRTCYVNNPSFTKFCDIFIDLQKSEKQGEINT